MADKDQKKGTSKGSSTSKPAPSGGKKGETKKGK